MIRTDSRRSLAGTALLFAMGGLALFSGQLMAKELSRDQEIADLQRQLQELNRRLEALQKQSAPRTPPSPGVLPAAWVSSLHWRSIGPATMGGRIAALSVFEADPTNYWVGTASGGLLKTSNNGVTFEHQFDHEGTVSIGDVCVAPSDRNIVWVGTGEANPRNSVSYGDGVYKSTDGGKTWKHMGLRSSFQIGRILIDPKDANTVYVGALGRLYGPSEERGLYKTTDGGKTWQKILWVNDQTGVIDMALNPSDPQTLLVATWERQRDGFDSHRGEPPVPDGDDPYDPVTKWGRGSALWKSTDGGRSFRRLTNGLPTAAMGRIGLSWYRKDPRVVFAIIDTEKIGLGLPPSTTYLGVRGEDAPGGGAKIIAVTPDSPAAGALLKAGDVVERVAKKDIKTYADLTAEIAAHKSGERVSMKVRRGKDRLELTATLQRRPTAPLPGEPRSQPALDFAGEDSPHGVRITQVTPRSPSTSTDLRAGDLLQRLGDTEVHSFKQVVDVLGRQRAGGKVAARVLRGKEVREITLLAPGKPRTGFRSNRPNAFWYGGQRENLQDSQGPGGHEYGGVYRSSDGGESWTRINSVNPRPMYFSQIRVDPNDEKFLYVLGVFMYRSTDGGKTFKMADGDRVHPDQHALWIDPHDSRHLLVGCDGGFYVSYDRAATWQYLCTTAIGQFYHVAVDSRRPYRVYGGLQDNGSWGGPSRSLTGEGSLNEDWSLVWGGDGFICQVDPSDPDLVYFEWQDGNMGRRNLRTGDAHLIQPRCPPGAPPYRFNWKTPFLLSHHNSRIFYCAGNYIFRSVHCGDDLKPVSPEITRTGRGSATALAESPLNPDVLWAGTDDGWLWVTRDGGKNWTNVVDKLGLPGPRWVASIEPSRFAEGRAYVVLDAHRSDDDNPYVYVTQDYGATWQSLRANLPWGSTRVLREDLENPDLLYLGTEFAVWASVDRGRNWTRINSNLPTVAVHEFAQHPTAGEIVAATHGRSLWVLDVSALRQMTAEMKHSPVVLFRPALATRWRSEPSHVQPYGAGHHRFLGENPPGGASIYYALSSKAQKIQLQIVDYTGKAIRTLEVKNEPGLHRSSWDLLREDPQWSGLSGSIRRVLPQRSTLPPGRAPSAQSQGAQPAPPGMYRVVLHVDGKIFTQPLQLEQDPLLHGANMAVQPSTEKRRNKEIDDGDRGEACLLRHLGRAGDYLRLCLCSAL